MRSEFIITDNEKRILNMPYKYIKAKFEDMKSKDYYKGHNLKLIKVSYNGSSYYSHQILDEIQL